MEKNNLKIFKDVEIPGLNIHDGLARLDYDEEAYLEVLHCYITHITKFTDTIHREANNNLNEYRIAVHGLKSSCRGIGADLLGYEAEVLENAAREGKTGLITNNTDFLVKSVEDFRIGLAGILQDIEAKYKKSKPEKDKPDAELIQKIKKASEDYDIDELKSAIKELEIFDYSSAPGLAEWLYEQANCSNFTEITEKFDALK